MVNRQKVKCKKCKAIYVIGWMEFDKNDEYCPNCGEQDYLVVISEDYKNNGNAFRKESKC